MKKTLRIIAAAAMAALAVSCSHKETKMESAKFEKANKLVNLTIDVELPAKLGHIHSTLYDLVEQELCTAAIGDGSQVIDTFYGDDGDIQEALDYYGEALFQYLEGLAAEDATYRENSANIVETPDSSDFTWEYNYTLMKTAETDKYIVFLSQGYVYMGGAHGGVTGSGYITFDKSSGEKVAEFIKPGSEAAMQSLIVEGLVKYFKEGGEDDVTTGNIQDYLLLDNTEEIPLPVNAPCPTDEGLMFTYQQYEIACYAAGMPSFIIPYDKVEPFLTPEAKKILEK